MKEEKKKEANKASDEVFLKLNLIVGNRFKNCKASIKDIDFETYYMDDNEEKEKENNKEENLKTYKDKLILFVKKLNLELTFNEDDKKLSTNEFKD